MLLMFPLYIISLSVLLICSPIYSTQFTCSSEGECENEILECGEEEACNVECSANWACRGTKVQCPIHQQCNIKCYYDSTQSMEDNGQMICQFMKIYAAESSLLIINVSIGDRPNFEFPRTFEQSEIYCPTVYGINQVKPCQIYCDGDDVISRTNIYAMQGINDLSIQATNYSRPWCFRTNILKCGEDYNIECPLKNKQPFDCQDPLTNSVDQTCETYIVSSTSSTSTSIPISSSQTTINGETSSTMNESIVSTEIGNSTQTQIPTQTPTRPPTPDSQTTETETDDDELELGREEGLSNGELIIAILFPLFFCALILMGIGCCILKKRQQKNQSGSIDKRGTHKKINGDDGSGHIVKEIYDDDEIEDEESEHGHTGIDVGFDHDRDGDDVTNPEIYGKDNHMDKNRNISDYSSNDGDEDDDKSDMLRSDS